MDIFPRANEEHLLKYTEIFLYSRYHKHKKAYTVYLTIFPLLAVMGKDSNSVAGQISKEITELNCFYLLIFLLQEKLQQGSWI